MMPHRVLQALETAFAGDGVLDVGLAAVDAGAVTRLEAAPSGRVAWTVQSTLAPAGSRRGSLSAADAEGT
jgi:hypothetical protein